MNKRLAALLLLASIVFGVGKSVAQEPFQARIIGGKDATAEYDFFVSLVTKYEWGGATPGQHWNPVCGASYLGDRHVLTAAHCVNGFSKEEVFGVLPGNRSSALKYEYCTDDGVTPYNCTAYDSPDMMVTGYHFTGFLVYTGTQADVIEIKMSADTVTIHPSYDNTTLNNDVALIRLPFILSNDSVTLSEKTFSQLPTFATVIGHGNTSTQPNTSIPSAVLQEVELPKVSDEDCRVKYSRVFDDDSMLCAGYLDGTPPGSDQGQDSCQGDSGGPLFISSNGVIEQIGVVSFGDSCAKTYGVYSDIACLRNWILFGNTDSACATEGRLGSSGGSLSWWLVLLAIPLLVLRGKNLRAGMLIAITTLGLTACSSNPFKTDTPVVVFNPVINTAGLEFSVVSTGCTDESHLYLRAKGDTIEVRRTQADLCRAAPHLVRFVMPLPESETVWRLKNPVRYSNRVGAGLEGQGTELR